MPRARKHRISTKPVFSENRGGTERDEKFTLKYNKTISSTNSHGTINCVVYDAKCKGNLALHHPTHYNLSWKQTWMAFVSFNRPTFASRHRSWLTLHIRFKYLQNPVCHRSVFGNLRVEVATRDLGGLLQRIYLFFLSFLSLPSPSLILSFLPFSLSQETKSSIDTHSEGLKCTCSILSTLT